MAAFAPEQSSSLIPADVPWQRVLDAFLNSALDSPASVTAYRRQCVKALDRLGVRSLAELDGELLGRYRAEVLADPDLVRSQFVWRETPGAPARPADFSLRQSDFSGRGIATDGRLDFCFRGMANAVPLQLEEITPSGETEDVLKQLP